MSLWDDYKVDAQFAHDFPFGVPNEYWNGKDGEILVTDMTDQHIRNCMRMVGENDDWYSYFQKELDRRKDCRRRYKERE